jgi:hypothetical protein
MSLTEIFLFFEFRISRPIYDRIYARLIRFSFFKHGIGQQISKYVYSKVNRLSPQERREREEQRQKIELEVQRREDVVQAKVDVAKPLLTGKSWHDPAGKDEFVSSLYNGEVPQYLWYSVPDITSLTREESQPLRDFFWGEAGPTFGDIELHASRSSEVVRGLRIRHARQFAAEIELNGKLYPLYQVGHRSSLTGIQTPEAPCVHFLNLYDQPESVSV